MPSCAALLNGPAKRGKFYSEICGFLHARPSIAIVGSVHLCLEDLASQPANVNEPWSPMGRWSWSQSLPLVLQTWFYR